MNALDSALTHAHYGESCQDDVRRRVLLRADVVAQTTAPLATWILVSNSTRMAHAGAFSDVAAEHQVPAWALGRHFNPAEEPGP